MHNYAYIICYFFPHRHMAQLVLKEIGRTPGPDCEFAENRESYSLAAGMALGMITLGVRIKPSN